MRYLITGLFLALLLSGCGKSEVSTKAPSSGKPGDMVVIMDSVQWNGPLGREVRLTFAAEIPGLPQPEPYFDINQIQPARLRLIRQVRNLVYVITLDNPRGAGKRLIAEFDEKTIAKINSDTSFFYAALKDKYATKQQVLYLFGKSEAALIKNMQRNRLKIRDIFERAENDRLRQGIISIKDQNSITAFLEKNEQVSIRMPGFYRIADQHKDFIWLRYMDAIIDKDVIIAWKPYTSEKQLSPDSLVAWRNKLGKKYLYGDPELPDTYVETEQVHDFVLAQNTTINGNFASEIKGLWITHNRGMGGPFIGYGIPDPEAGRLYYIEGFVFAPGKDKREMMRELRIILSTFKTSKNLNQKG